MLDRGQKDLLIAVSPLLALAALILAFLLGVHWLNLAYSVP